MVFTTTILNDGLLLLELWDAMHEGDGPQVLHCWMFCCSTSNMEGRLETQHLFRAVNAIATPRVASELIWYRLVNSGGGAGNNLPVDLYMEHLNRTLKDYLHGLGANLSKPTIIKTSKSLRSLLEVCAQFDLISAVLAITSGNQTTSRQTSLVYGQC